MEKIIIRGGHRLTGEVSVAGAKDAILPIQAAVVMASSGTVKLGNVPPVVDVKLMNQLLRSLNITVNFDERLHVLQLIATDSISAIQPVDVKQLQFSLVLGALLARTGHVKIALPDNNQQGLWLTDLMNGFQKLGATINQHHEYCEIIAENLSGARLLLERPDVRVTENLMMAAALAQGITTIENPAQDPEVIELANALNKMGARVHGAGTEIIRIQGVNFLHGCEYEVMPDRIEAGNFMIAAAVTNGDVLVKGAIAKQHKALIDSLEEMGVTVVVQHDGIRVLGTAVLLPAKITVSPFPGFPADLLLSIAVLQLLANGTSLLDGAFDDSSFKDLTVLRQLNAKVQLQGSMVRLDGPTNFKETTVTAKSLQVTLAIVLAGLALKGKTELQDQIGLGSAYYHFFQKLQGLGAQIDCVQ